VAAGWLRRNGSATVLSVFDHACNLIDEQGMVVALVSPEVGNGPFHAVLNERIPFGALLHPRSTIRVQAGRMIADRMAIDFRFSHLWSPIPDWGGLRAALDHIIPRVLRLAASFSLLNVAGSTHTPQSRRSRWGAMPLPFAWAHAAQAAQTLCAAVATADPPACAVAAAALAGLGPGSTPSGDDYLLGAIYASWLIHPGADARAIASSIVAVAAPRTTSLSAAWLIAARRGECGAPWHQLFTLLEGADDDALHSAAVRILSAGASSGQEALAAFLGVFNAHATLERAACASLMH